MKRNTGEIILIAVICLAMIFAIGQARIRYQVETGNRSVEILVDYGDLLEQVERHSQGAFTAMEFLDVLQENGVGGVLFKEESLEDLLRLGEIQAVPGVQLFAASRSGYLRGSMAGFAGLEPFNRSHLYLEIFDPLLWERVSFQLEMKIPGTVLRRSPEPIPAGDGDIGNESPALLSGGILSLPLTLDEFADIGAGFPSAALETVSAHGFNIYLQMYNWSGNEESIPSLMAPLATLPKIKGILFQSAGFPGYPGYTKNFAAELARLQIPIVTIDLFELQRAPLLSLVRSSPQKEVFRLHAIPADERALLSKQRTLDRYILAAGERNNRLLLVRCSGASLRGEAWLQENTGFIRLLGDRLTSAGLELAAAKPYSNAPFPFSRERIMFICAGILAGLLLVFKKIGAPLPGFLLSASGLLLTGMLLVWNNTILGMGSIDLTCKAMALVSGVTFPLLGLVYFRETFGNHSLLKSILALLGISAFSLAGALLAAGLVTDLTYLIKLDQLQGIRAALILPLPLAWLLMLTADETTSQGIGRKLMALFNRPLEVGIVVMTVLLIAAAYILLSRSGNESAFVSDFELRLRSLLGNLLSVRPRTKEFLIGHPLLLLALYRGFRNRIGVIIAILGMIGQVSLINTFYHLHTPLAISLQRTAIGLLLGVIIGLCLPPIAKQIEKIMQN